MSLSVSVAYLAHDRQTWLKFEIAEGATVEDAILRSGILAQAPEIDLSVHKTGIFGRIVPLSEPLCDGDRVEIYRPATARPPKRA